jgi:FkbM family methyltransferase
MDCSSARGNMLVGAYALVRRSGFLQTSVGHRVFKASYFLYKRYFEDDLQALLRARPDLIGDGHVLDIGANIGYTAAVLARMVRPGYKVYAFEPEPFNFGSLQQTAMRSEFAGKIVPLEFAVGAENGKIDLWINERHHADHRVATQAFYSGNPKLKAVRTAMLSVDNFLESLTGRVAFIKIDVQGYELAVCEGMQEALRLNPDLSVVLEFTPSMMIELGFDPSKLIDFFAQRNFGVYVVHRGGRLTSGLPKDMKDESYVDLLFSRRPIM